MSARRQPSSRRGVALSERSSSRGVAVRLRGRSRYPRAANVHGRITRANSRSRRGATDRDKRGWEISPGQRGRQHSGAKIVVMNRALLVLLVISACHPSPRPRPSAGDQIFTVPTGNSQEEPADQSACCLPQRQLSRRSHARQRCVLLRKGPRDLQRPEKRVQRDQRRDLLRIEGQRHHAGVPLSAAAERVASMTPL